MKYHLEIIWTSGFDEKNNALSKARIDAIVTLDNMEWEQIPIKLKAGKNKIEWAICKCILILKLVHTLLRLRINSNDTVLVQYPCLHKTESIVINLLHICKCQIILLIHDLEYLRYNSSNDKARRQEIALLSKSSLIIAHTKSMKLELCRNGINADKIGILNLFDYYSDAPLLRVADIIKYKDTIAYAGNLVKSPFLDKMSQLITTNKVNLYGIDNGKWRYTVSPQIKYCGCFEPDNPSVLIAGWGLVWDGEDVNTCSGIFGNYLKYNVSHKLSLYISAGIPAIVWDQSAVAEWVEAAHIGIAVPNIEEAFAKINDMDEGEYLEYINNAHIHGERVRHGDYLKTTLEKVI